MTGASATLFHLGNVVIDIVARVDDLPPQGGDVIASGSLVTPGGGFNVMAAATRQGLSTVYGGLLGSGPFGALAAQALNAENISYSREPERDTDTGFVICLVDSQGERTFVTAPGAEAQLTPRHLEQIVPSPSDLVYVSGYSLIYPSNRNTLLPWISNLPKDTMLFFDPGPLVAEIPVQALAVLWDRAQWVTCNAREATLLTKEDSPARAAWRIAQTTRHQQIVVRDGARGCVFVCQDQPPTPVPGLIVDVVDTNGAGDTHTGTFMAALARSMPPYEALQWANGAAAWSVTQSGPATSPTHQELLDWLSVE